MTSQQVIQGGDQQSAMAATIVDQKKDASSLYNAAWPAHLPAMRQLSEVDQKLFDVSSILDTARQILSEFTTYAGGLVAYEHAYYEERKKSIECAQAYENLHIQHNKAISDLHATHSECLSLQQELENTQNAMQTLRGRIQEQQPPGIGSNANVSNSERERLHSRIEELEREKSEMKREHHAALANATDNTWTIKQRADELENLLVASPGHAVVPKPRGGANRSRRRKQVASKHKRAKLRLQPSSISAPIPETIEPIDLTDPVRIEEATEIRQAAKKIPNSDLSQMIEKRTWENEQLRKELVYQQRKHGASVYLMEEVKLAVESLEKALVNFQQYYAEIEKDSGV